MAYSLAIGKKAKQNLGREHDKRVKARGDAWDDAWPSGKVHMVFFTHEQGVVGATPLSNENNLP
jgi:hypothetical protein